MKVLVACEFSGIVRDAFTRRGHYAVSCDLLPCEVAGRHHQGDVLEILDQGWDLMIAHPPCTFLSSSGLHWNGRVEGRAAKTEDGLEFARRLLYCDIPRICVENPRGCIGTRTGRPSDQVIHPWQFGHDASKETHLWLKSLPALKHTKRFPGRWVRHGGKMVERWSNQTDAGQNRLSPSPDRWALRSETYPGIADAMAEQWSNLGEPIPLLI